MLHKKLLPSFLALSLLLPLASLANDTSVGVQSGQVMPIKSSTLRLLREDLHISLSPEKVIVEVAFRLQNEGKDAKVQLGFPYYSASDSLYEDDNSRPDVYDFRCAVDGASTVCSDEKGPNLDPKGTGAGFKFTRWKMWSVPFKAGQIRTISHRYRGDLGSSVAGRFDPPSVSFFDYILTTGRNWKGPIQEFHLVITPTGGMRPSDIYGVSLPGLKPDGDSFRLDLSNFTPHQELFISLLNDFERHPLKSPANWINPGFKLKSSKEVLPHSDSRALTEADLKGRSARDLTLMRNEIYARKGRPFQDPELRKYFSSQQWYKPNPQYTDANLTEIESRNVRIILDYQKRHRLMW